MASWEGLRIYPEVHEKDVRPAVSVKVCHKYLTGVDRFRHFA